METTHRVTTGDSRSLSKMNNNSVDLAVTSPPYPMIEMWDELFSGLNSDIGEHLENGDGQSAFAQMHREFEKVWTEASWQLAPEPWGENDEPPVVELYANNHVNVTTGRHISDTSLQVAEWDSKVLETILEAVGECDPKPPSDVGTLLDEYDFDEWESSE